MKNSENLYKCPNCDKYTISQHCEKCGCKTEFIEILKVAIESNKIKYKISKLFNFIFIFLIPIIMINHIIIEEKIKNYYETEIYNAKYAITMQSITLKDAIKLNNDIYFLLLKDLDK